MSRANSTAWKAAGLRNPSFETAQQFAASMARLQAHAAKAVIDYNLEAVDFVKHRLTRDADFVARMAASKDFGEAFGVCSDFWQQAFTEYTDEAGKLTAMNTRVAQASATEMGQEMASEFAQRGAA